VEAGAVVDVDAAPACINPRRWRRNATRKGTEVRSGHVGGVGEGDSSTNMLAAVVAAGAVESDIGGDGESGHGVANLPCSRMNPSPSQTMQPTLRTLGVGVENAPGTREDGQEAFAGVSMASECSRSIQRVQGLSMAAVRAGPSDTQGSTRRWRMKDTAGVQRLSAARSLLVQCKAAEKIGLWARQAC
jgi:hypothetical protein